MPLMTEDDLEISKQVTLIGYGSCGKTSLLNKHLYKEFEEQKRTTTFSAVKSEYKVKNKIIELRLWDTAGQNELTRLRELAIPYANYILICYSVDCKTSFNEVTDTFVPQVNEISPNAQIFLVATKIDLRNDRKTIERLAEKSEFPITKNEGIKLGKKIRAVAYFECSAKEGLGVDEIFEKIAKYAYKETVHGDSHWYDCLLCCRSNDL